MIVEYRFESFRVGGSGGEVWACKIPAGHLLDIDKGAYIIIQPRLSSPTSVVNGTARWGRLQGVAHGWLWVDGVHHRFAPTDEVWLGYNPEGPSHLQRGTFEREIPDPPEVKWDATVSPFELKFRCKAATSPLDTFDQFAAAARRDIERQIAQIDPQAADTMHFTITIDTADTIRRSMGRNDSKPTERTCCQLDCGQPAEFEITHNCPGSHSSDGCGTDACAVHLGDLLRGCIHGIDYVTEYTVTDISETQ